MGSFLNTVNGWFGAGPKPVSEHLVAGLTLEPGLAEVRNITSRGGIDVG
jgi:hypothetical protein